MRFKPFSESYDFSKAELSEDYPDHFNTPLYEWIYKMLDENDLGWSKGYGNNISVIKTEVLGRFNVIFRENFPDNINIFISKLLSDADLTSNFLALMLQNYANATSAGKLEVILSRGGSAFKVIKTDMSAGSYEKGAYDLERRVSEIVAEQAKLSIDGNELLKDAWRAFYSLNPDYEKTVNKSCDALEHLLKDNYEPKNGKPQLGVMIKNLIASPEKMAYKGDTLLLDKSVLLRLIDKATTVRGTHTAGTGRKPTADEAEFILHATIFIHNMHNKL